MPWIATAAARPAATAAQLPDALRRKLAGSGLPLPSFGLYARPVGQPRVLLSLNAEAPFTLASTAKIVTSLAALDLLGPGFRWRTYAFLTGPLDRGFLRGDLMLVGGGDPLLSTAELRHWFGRLRAQGLREIGGDIVIDRSAFALHEEDHAGTPEPGPDRPHHVRPDAFTIDAGVVHLRLETAGGPRTEVHTELPLPGVPLVNKVAASGGCRTALRWSEAQGRTQLWVEGAWAAHCGARELTVVPPSHADFVASAVVGLWREAGGRLGGRVRFGDLNAVDPARERLPLFVADGAALPPFATHVSAPLPEVLREVNKTSHNLGARHLMLSLARGFPLQSATLARARERVRDWLARQGIAPGDIELDNGSGLSRFERGKPRALAQLLSHAWTAREASAFVDSLPVAGVDGTLAHRMQGGYAAGQAHLKTGTLLDTRALAGYVRGRSGRVHAVAALVNHPEAARATAALEAAIEWLARNG